MKFSEFIRAPFAHMGAFLLAYVLVPSLSYATTNSGFAGAKEFDAQDNGITKFVENITTILNYVSIGVVTIAFIFAGYQIAFANKRVSDVAPVLIGGVVIGAAGQFANMLLAPGVASS